LITCAALTTNPDERQVFLVRLKCQFLNVLTRKDGHGTVHPFCNLLEKTCGQDRDVLYANPAAAACPKNSTTIIEWDTWARSERDTLRCRARVLGAAVELHYLSATVYVLFDRIQRRGLENPPVGRDTVLRWLEMFQVPTPEELELFDTVELINFTDLS
jgi:hypothetical protein